MKLLLNSFDLYLVLKKSADQFFELHKHEKRAHYCLRLINITRNPASRASERVRLVAIRPSSYVHRICNFKDYKEGIYISCFSSHAIGIHLFKANNSNVKRVYPFNLARFLDKQC